MVKLIEFHETGIYNFVNKYPISIPKIIELMNMPRENKFEYKITKKIVGFTELSMSKLEKKIGVIRKTSDALINVINI
jgi:hypothetical protein